MKKIFFFFLVVATTQRAFSQNVGIGTTNPAYRLDVAGRMRLQQSSAGTAGLWLDGTSAPLRSFIGMADNDHVGFFGGGGSGWRFTYNVNNGNTGIGTQTPTATLDVNGSLRFRGSFPKKGSVMTSQDVSGNAGWADPVAFRASGIDKTLMPNTPLGVWTKVFFDAVPDYNLGLIYQQLNSQLGIVEDGIYHLNTSFHVATYLEDLEVRIRLNRGGVISTIATHEKSRYNLQDPPQLTDIVFTDAVSVATDVRLLAGDIVWVEIFVDTDYFTTPFGISTQNERAWFSGHLITRF